MIFSFEIARNALFGLSFEYSSDLLWHRPLMATRNNTRSTLLRNLPSVDRLLRTPMAASLRPSAGFEQLARMARKVTDELRQELSAAKTLTLDGNGQTARAALLEEAARRLSAMYRQEASRGLTRVINATGVILHTNLGRASLSEAARQAILDAAGYCNLEFDLASGARGRRGARAEDLLVNLTGSEAALVVNNCAAAALLVLTVIAGDGETIVSRGELVEIGGDFRVPDVMAQSGTRMIEVGTTNRTRLSDYRRAISEDTRLVLRVHPSNYRIVGFTKTPALGDLAELTRKAGLTLYEDAGSGALVDLSEFGIKGEPIISASISDGADVVSFSGDKLLGGPQVGCIVGRATIVERLRSHPLYRALRADKLRIAALEATLDAYARDSLAGVPTHGALAMTNSLLKNRAQRFVERVREAGLDSKFSIELIPGESATGGGAAPTARLPTELISIAHPKLSANEIESSLRGGIPPVIARIANDRIVFDLRTVSEREESELETALLALS
jgi:L-seryl-tRNA(Ser) seleniumtransferase